LIIVLECNSDLKAGRVLRREPYLRINDNYQESPLLGE
jgi:hypothetical protein